MSQHRAKSRSYLLASVGTAAFAAMLAGGAHAADTTIDENLAATIEASSKSSSMLQNNEGAATATVDGAHGGITQVDTPTTDTPADITENTIRATAKGNVVTGDTTIDLSTIDSDPVDGAASLALQLNSGAISSTVSASSLSGEFDEFATGTVENSSNAIVAETLINNSAVEIAGDLPAGYSSATTGSSVLAFPMTAGTDVFDGSGSVLATTAQMNTALGGSATANGNSVSLELTAEADNTLSVNADLESNDIAANLIGNTATNTVDVRGGVPTFEGSAVVSNLQVNTVGDAASYDADNSGSSITATTSSDTGTNELTGVLSVAGNSIQANATGNDAAGSTTAGNRILLGEGVSFDGSGTGSASTSLAYDSGDLRESVTGDLIIHNSQGNKGASTADPLEFNSTVSGATVSADVDSVSGGTVRVDGNNLAATTTGNTARSALATGATVNSIDGSVALSSQQINEDVVLTATVSGGQIEATINGGADEVIENSTITVSDNTASASVYGNDVAQSMSLDANTAGTGSGSAVLTGGTGPDGNVSAEGAVIVSSLQANSNSVLTATQSSDITLRMNSEDAAGSSLLADGNVLEALAVDNSSGNALSLSGNSVGQAVGVANVQVADAESSVTATSSGQIAITGIDLIGGTTTLSNNLVRGIAYGASTVNSLSADAGNMTLVSSGAEVASEVNFDAVAADGLALDNTVGDQPTVQAPFGVLNVQNQQGDISGSALADSAILVDAGMDVQDGATVNNTGNALVGAAYGNNAAGTVSLVLNDAETDGDFATVANITNVQTVGTASTITAQAIGEDAIQTRVVESVEGGSTVDTSGNTLQALAFGNRAGTSQAAGNQLVVDANNVDTAATGSERGGARQSTVGDVTTYTTDASFSVQSVQSAAGDISAALTDGAAPAGGDTASRVVTTIGQGVSGSTVGSDANQSLASATANSVNNAVQIEGNNLATTSALQNLQSSGAVVTADIGIAGTAGTAGSPVSPFSITIVDGAGYTLGSETGSGTDAYNVSGMVETDVSGLSADQKAYLLANDWMDLGGDIFQADVQDVFGMTISSAVDNALTGAGQLRAETAPGSSGTPRVANEGGVSIVVDGAITASRLSVDGNVTAGSVTGNAATNSQMVDVNSIAVGSDRTAAFVDGEEASADHVLRNVQASASTLTSTVYGAFGLDLDETAGVSDSTLSVAGNSQSAKAIANTASNTQGLMAGTDLTAGSALSSQQGGSGAVSATSDLDVFASAAVSGSKVDLSGNTNTSLAVQNDVVNTVAVSGNDLAPVDTAVNVDLNGTPGEASGDHLLANTQTASTSVTSSATTRLYNRDEFLAETSGLQDSTFSIADNRTVAEASANRASNMLSLEGTSSMGANGGVMNVQTSSAAVQSTATTTTGVTLGADGTAVPATAALNASTLSVAGNSTGALARGNSGTNVLNVEAGAVYGATTATTAGSTLGAGGSVGATVGILNNQNNTGTVQALSSNASYNVALNGNGAANPLMSTGTVSINGNAIQAEAYGNSVTNAMTVAALNSGAPTAAVGSYQSNTAAVTAQVTSASFMLENTSGSMAGSALHVGGNLVSATAIGNQATSSITGK